jgi:hypothetical protein
MAAGSFIREFRRRTVEWSSSHPGPRRSTAHRAAQCGNAPLQFLVDLAELIGALKLIDRHAESAQHAQEQKREPDLQAPTDGVGEHWECAQSSIQ